MKRLLTLLLAALLSTAATLHAQEIAEITPPAQAAAETQEHPAQSRPTTIVRRVPGDRSRQAECERDSHTRSTN